MGSQSDFFRLRLRSWSKIFESGSGSEIFPNIRIQLLFGLWLKSILDAWKITTQTTASTEIEKRCRHVACFLKIFYANPVPLRKINEESCRSRLDHSGSMATSVIYVRGEHCIWIGLDPAMTNIANFGLDADCKVLNKFRIMTGFGLS